MDIKQMASIYQHQIYQPRNSGLPLTLFWVITFTIISYIEFQGWLPRWLLALLTAPAALVAFLNYTHFFLRLRWSVQTHGTNLPGLILRMVNLFPKLARFRVEMQKILIHISLAIIAFTLCIGLRVYSLLPLSALLLSIATIVLLRAILPPGGVYLASSNPERVEFFIQLSYRTIPQIAALLEVSTLLDPDKRDRNFFLDAAGALNDYRTLNPDDWTMVVKQLMEMSAIIVVDGRDHTAGLQLEVERILRNRFELKTVFISDDGTMPHILSRLNAKSSHPSGTFQLMTPDDALYAIPVFLKNAKAFWTPARMDA